MALTTTEETQVRELLVKQAEILSLAENETPILSNLGAEQITTDQFPETSTAAEDDTFLLRQGTTDKKIKGKNLRDSLRINGGLTLVNLVGWTPATDGTTVDIASFYAGYSTTTAGASGGGKFVWVASAAKSLHDGALYISPTVPWDGTSATLAAWQNKTGETSPAGTGCWRRVTDGLDVCSSWWGTVSNDTTIDAATALSKMWAYVTASIAVPANNLRRVNVKAKVPAGKYLINSSVNFCNVLCWNLFFEAEGAVFIAGSGVSGKAMFDVSNVRGLHWSGGTIESTLAELNAPFAGLLLAPRLTDTCGNNRFDNLKINGIFTYAPLVNIGSETSYFFNCYFAQTATDISARRYAFAPDGMHSDSRVVSDYVTLRGNGIAVSFTNNRFYGCHFRNYGQDGYNSGSAIFMRTCIGWEFDRGCYYLTFDKSAFEIYNDPTYRNTNIKIDGSFETSQRAGMTDVIKMIVPDGGNCAIDKFSFTTQTPLASNSVIKMVNTALGTTTGTLKLTQATVETSSLLLGASMFSQCAGLSVFGSIGSRASSQINIKDIASFKGALYVMNRAELDLTGVAAKPMAFTILDETGDGYWVGPRTHSGNFTVTGEVNAGALEAASLGSNSWLSVTSLSAGVADCGARSLVSIGLSSAQTLTGLIDTSTVNAPLIMLRNVSSFDLTVQHNASSLRLNGQTNKILKTNDSITFAKVASGIYQQLGGSNGYHAGDFTVTGEVNASALEAASFGSNGWFSVTSLSSGVADCSTRSLINIALASSDTITALTDSSTVSVPIIFMRNVNNNTVTFVNDPNFLRLLNGNNVTLNQYESIAFAKVATGVYIQICGKQSGVRNNSTGIGYGIGSGGTVTQATSKSTGVTLNKPTGSITMHAAALAAGASVSFVVTNSTAAATDSLSLGFDGSSGAPAGQELNYRLAWSMNGAGGGFTVVVQNTTGGSLSEAVKLRFALIKSVNS